MHFGEVSAHSNGQMGSRDWSVINQSSIIVGLRIARIADWQVTDCKDLGSGGFGGFGDMRIWGFVDLRIEGFCFGK